MSKLILNFYGTVFLKVRYDADSGHGKILWFRNTGRDSTGIVNWGYAHRRRLKWYALWKDGDNLIFQCGRRKWVLGGSTQLWSKLSEDGNKRTFRVTENNVVVFELKYRESLVSYFFSRFSSTWDGMDEESEDFFLYAANMCP